MDRQTDGAGLSAFDLSGRTAVVTGGGSGIGRATGEVLGAAGANVVLGDIDEDAAAETVRSITDAGGKALAQWTDITSKADIDALVSRAVSEFGRLDAMCNIAGVPADGLLMDVSEADVDRLVALNVKGTLFGCQAAVRAMEGQGSGSIVNVASAAIDIAAPSYGLYAMTKAAVAQLTKTLALEVAKQGIRVNTIAPGFTVSGFTTRHLYEEDGTLNQEKYDAFVDQMRKRSPLGLVGQPIDQAYLILYLVSDAARFCTGQIWRANGGQVIV
ncbi:MAG: SDR family NAD(P)-dependent oxidoreductase [Actinomycetota bacterium]